MRQYFEMIKIFPSLFHTAHRRNRSSWKPSCCFITSHNHSWITVCSTEIKLGLYSSERYFQQFYLFLIQFAEQ